MVTQSILGLIAYLIVADIDKLYAFQVLGQAVEEVAHNVAIPLVTGDPGNIALEQTHRNFAPTADLALIMDHKGIRGIAGPSHKRLDNDALSAVLRKAMADSGDTKGRISLAEGDFLWVSAPVVGLPLQLVLLDHAGTSGSTLTTTLSSRFLATSIVILWVAVWIALVFASIISRKLNEKTSALRHQVTHDTLTGLPNRALLYEQLSGAIASADATTNGALLVIDINRFKQINDTLGYDFGDQLLLEMGARIQQSLPAKAFLARLGGNEFAVFLNDSNEQQAHLYIQQLLASMYEDPFNINQVELEISLSIGLAFFPQHADDADSLVRCADVAMHQARDSHTSYSIYNGEKDGHSVRTLLLGTELRQAISGGQLILFYQPKIALATGEVIGLEALVRWEHPALGLIPPDEFIGLAEQTGAIQELTDWVLEEALYFLRKLHRSGMTPGIAVNISTQCLRDFQLKPRIMELLKNTGIASHHLTLEITENVMMQDIDFAQEVLESLHKLGLRISIDDFGTGFSSLSYLNHLPVDELKVDRSFVLKMMESSDDQAIVESVVELAHTLGCSVVAEGVENQDALAALEKMQCDTAQGYHISKPQPADIIQRWLEEYNAAPALSVPAGTS
ncbi:MAG: putative bifunctional diguanylate cyclase/phosphodiesterase [Thiogranum sp.]